MFHNWRAIVDITQCPEIASVRDLESARNFIETILIYRHVREIVISTVVTPMARMILDFWPGSDIMLFDNGLESYAAFDVVDDQSAPLLGKHVRSAHVSRIRHFYNSLYEYFSPPNYITSIKQINIDAADILAAISRIHESNQSFFDKPPKLDRLYIGTSFSRTDKISQATENGLYRQAINADVNRGLDIGFKPHHRASDFTIDCSSYYPSELHSNIPVEVLFYDAPPAKAYSISSTSLLMLHKLYGTWPVQLLDDRIGLVRKLTPVFLLSNALEKIYSDAKKGPQISNEGERLIEQYRLLHKRKKYGAYSTDQFHYILPWLETINPNTILDYGCGQSLLVDQLAKALNASPKRYDPAISKYAVPPSEPIDCVINTDVLEHIPERDIDQFLTAIAEVSGHVFFNISSVPAVNLLPNGENAHCTVENNGWWRDRLKAFFPNVTEVPSFRTSTCSFITWQLSEDVMDEKLIYINSNTSQIIDLPQANISAN